MEEDEDLHNKLKCDQDTSDEQIAADNVKISILGTIGESASVAQLTAEIDTLEKDLLAKSEISEFSNVTAICDDLEEIEVQELEELMTCSCQSDTNFNQASLQVESETGRSVLEQGRCAFPACSTPDHKSKSFKRYER